SSRTVIRRITPDGIIRTAAGGGSSGDGPASQVDLGSGASQIVAGPDGALYFLQQSQQRIRKLTTQGNIVTIASPVSQSAHDGTRAKDAWLPASSGMTVGRSGALYILEPCRIRRIGSDGVLRTAAGSGACGGLPNDPPSGFSWVVVDAQEQIYFQYQSG